MVSLNNYNFVEKRKLIYMRKLHLSVEGQPVSVDYKEHFANLVKINQSLNQGAQKSFHKRKRVFVDVPQIVGITGACENVDTLFKVGSRNGLPLFFTQTGQLALEQALQSFSAVYTIIHSGRDEEIEDVRHLRQFRLTEEEFDSTMLGMDRKGYDEDVMYEALLKNIQSTAQAMIKEILKDNEEMLKKVYKVNVKRLYHTSTKDFLRISYEDAVKLLNKYGYPKVKFGDDLISEYEAKIVKVVNKKDEYLPVFIMKYPKEIKFFNMKTYTKDTRLALSADLIFPFAGEGTGSAVREHDYSKLRERLVTSTMYKLHLKRGGTYKDFLWYLNIMKQKATMPHAGYGMGNDRVMQYILGEKDIRNISVFSQLNNQTGDWNRRK
jgi:asparaginyl-tRNA synthetase